MNAGDDLVGARLGIVVIGRNEGPRLADSLAAAIASGVPVVYVDSRSSDGSVRLARALGVHVCEWQSDVAPNAARARIAGVQAIRDIMPGLQFVQFVDGDTVLADGWVESALAHMTREVGVSAVCGHLSEQGASRDCWSMILDLEWQGPVGEIESTGGNAMIRLSAYENAGGFNPELSEGEEPDLCRRMRAEGWRVERIDHDMGEHCARGKGLRLWWRRAVRGGAALVGAYRTSAAMEARAGMAGLRRIAFWAGVAPVSIGVAALTITPWLLLLLFVYPMQMMRIALRARSAGHSWLPSMAYGVSSVSDKFPQAIGVIRAVLRKSG